MAQIRPITHRIADVSVHTVPFCLAELFSQEKCTLMFNGDAPAGQYSIYLMAEDMFPVPKTVHATDNKSLSAVPVHLSLTGESVKHVSKNIKGIN